MRTINLELVEISSAPEYKRYTNKKMRTINLELVELSSALEYRRYTNKKGDFKKLLKNVEYVFSTEGIHFSCSLYMEHEDNIKIIKINGKEHKSWNILEDLIYDLKSLYTFLITNYGFLPSYREHENNMFCFIDKGEYKDKKFSDVILNENYLVLLGHTEKGMQVTAEYDENFFDDVNIVYYEDIKDVDLVVASDKAILDIYTASGVVSTEVSLSFDESSLSQVASLRRDIKAYLLQ